MAVTTKGHGAPLTPPYVRVLRTSLRSKDRSGVFLLIHLYGGSLNRNFNFRVVINHGLVSSSFETRCSCCLMIFKTVLNLKIFDSIEVLSFENQLMLSQ